MSKTPRPYQKKAIQECLIALKESDSPVLLMASVGSGKSLMISELLLIFEKQNKRALCLVNNSELVRNNAKTFSDQGGNPTIYCASLESNDSSGQVVFGTPQSVLNGIKRQEAIANIKFNIIIVDEAHAINYQNHQTTFMRILRHYKQEYPSMRVLGATGTNFRYKGEPIVGLGCLFQKQVGDITTHWLIENNYLVKPKFEIDEEFVIDFSSVKLNSMGKFDNKQLESVIEKNQRLTGKILSHLQQIMTSQNRFGCFIFCSTVHHCHEAYKSLPPEQTAIITGNTKQSDRIEILDKARKGEIKYLINVQVLTVGIDVPGYDTLLFLRPTESLVLMVQMIGRALRLYPSKQEALIIDCAGNIDRHADWDDPIIIEAIKQTRDSDVELIFPCPVCETMNGMHARRCTGTVEQKRCEFYFEFKECPECSAQNDIVSRNCRQCKHELIDPNAKLSDKPFKSATIDVDVLQAKYWLQDYDDKSRLHAAYKYQSPDHNLNTPLQIHESYSPMSSEKAKNLFYGQFVKNCVEDSSSWYPHLQNPIYLKAMLNYINTPKQLRLRWDGLKWSIWKKLFQEKSILESPVLPPQTLEPIKQNNLEIASIE